MHPCLALDLESTRPASATGALELAALALHFGFLRCQSALVPAHAAKTLALCECGPKPKCLTASRAFLAPRKRIVLDPVGARSASSSSVRHSPPAFSMRARAVPVKRSAATDSLGTSIRRWSSVMVATCGRRVSRAHQLSEASELASYHDDRLALVLLGCMRVGGRGHDLGQADRCACHQLLQPWACPQLERLTRPVGLGHHETAHHGVVEGRVGATWSDAVRIPPRQPRQMHSRSRNLYSRTSSLMYGFSDLGTSAAQGPWSTRDARGASCCVWRDAAGRRRACKQTLAAADSTGLTYCDARLVHDGGRDRFP